ncbi:MAG: SelL-related redox protein [Saprospiraceae bacterium]
MNHLTFLQNVKTQKGDSIWDLSFKSPVLVVLLRHFGCVFCKEALAELGKIQGIIRKQNTHLVLVHLSDSQTAESIFKSYGLENVDYVSDPDATVYQEFGLLKARLQQMIGLKVWLRTFQQGVIKGHGLNNPADGDVFQMPGVYLIWKGHVKDEYIHGTIADKPDYLKMSKCENCTP